MKLPSLKEWKQKFWSLPIVAEVLQWSKEKSLPGFFKVPIFDVVVFILNEIKRYALIMKANSMAFSFFLSLFPSIIALFTLLPYLREYLIAHIPGGENFMEYLYREINLLLPGNAGDMLIQTIEDITTRPRTGLLSLGFLLAIWFASNGILTMMNSFEKSYKQTFKRRSALRKRVLAIGLTFLLGSLLFASIILVIVGNLLVDLLDDYVHLDRFSEVAIALLRYLIILALFYTGMALIYRYAAAARKRFHFFTPGATLATILSILSSLGFSFYVDNFGTYNKLYGSIGTIIVVMLWLQINSFILLAGYELNASIAVNRDLKAEREEEEDEG
ncbi:MAG: YihY/virulence factor BrkB family protein [Saprospiraceae bacterium]|nr:YihY/virulence factor BrkB family protein [Saprospiraceae bacterium]MCB0623278.1 YihY/virulence factor BrkB family protein [Saprospiraceae bacterium]MCB0675078.1 YihY/virulence factor BrkB family protein [Saprospiraceae bacterium]MCB0682724.1 YihY/virulence factor BrkB family protein [Saprospiraceae bacterium]